MAKKAKKRGRPPGSKSVAKMDIAQLRSHIDRLEGMFAKKVSAQKAFIEGKLSELSGYATAKAAGIVRAVKRVARKKRAKAPPKYRSKKTPSQTWSGRGMTPIWMREEIKGTKLKRDDFLIAKSTK